MANYTAMHLNESWWISDGPNHKANYSAIDAKGYFFKGLGESWVAEAGCAENGQWTDQWWEGYFYLHSSYLDLVISGVAGLNARVASNHSLLVAPLQATDDEVSWWCLDGASVGGRLVTVLWDIDGTRYGRGKGLRVFLEGVLVGEANTVTASLSIAL